MKFFKVLIPNSEAKRLDKFAIDTLCGMKVFEKKLFFRRKRRVIYRFDNVDNAIDFLFGVKRNFGFDVFVEQLIDN